MISSQLSLQLCLQLIVLRNYAFAQTDKFQKNFEKNDRVRTFYRNGRFEYKYEGFFFALHLNFDKYSELSWLFDTSIANTVLAAALNLHPHYDLKNVHSGLLEAVTQVKRYISDNPI